MYMRQGWRYRRRGMGAVDLFGHCTGLLNPFNYFSPDCWALAFPETTGVIATITGNPSVTPEQMSSPSAAYPQMGPAPTLPAPPPGALTSPTGAVTSTAAQAAMLPGSLVAEAHPAAQAATLAEFQQQFPEAPPVSSGLPWWAWAVLGVGALAVVVGRS